MQLVLCNGVTEVVTCGYSYFNYNYGVFWGIFFVLLFGLDLSKMLCSKRVFCKYKANSIYNFAKLLSDEVNFFKLLRNTYLFNKTGYLNYLSHYVAFPSVILLQGSAFYIKLVKFYFL